MDYVNTIIGKPFDLMLGPLADRDPWIGMILVSFVASLILLAIFKYTSSQNRIRRRKNVMIARVLELLLFRNDIIVSMTALGRAVAANFFYLAWVLLPMLASMVPLALILTQTADWFDGRPLESGESVVVTARFLPSHKVMNQTISLETSDGFTVDSDPVRIPSLNEVSWRVRTSDGAVGSLGVSANGETFGKRVVAGLRMARTTRVRPSSGFWDQLAYPGEKVLPGGCPLASIEVQYPPSRLAVGDKDVHWLIAFLVLTMLFAFGLMKPFGVTI